MLIQNDISIEQLLRDKEYERKNNLTREMLEKYLKSYRFKLEELGLVFDKKIEKELREIIEISLAKNFVFRGDSRHPYAKSKYDKSMGIKKGIFEVGFNDEESQYGGVYSTADIHRALDYPHEKDMPKEWDNQKFVYFIDSKAVDYLDLRDAKESKNNNELVAGEIPPEYIEYAIQIDNKTGRVIEIFINNKKK